MRKTAIRILVASAFVGSCLVAGSGEVKAVDSVVGECAGVSDTNCFETPTFNYASDESDEFVANEHVCVKGTVGPREGVGGKMLGISFYANTCDSGIQDLNAASVTPVHADDVVMIVIRTNFRPDLTRGNADFQSSTTVKDGANKWVTTVIAKPIPDFMMASNDCQVLIENEPTITGFTHGCPNTPSNRLANALVHSKLTISLADWVAMEGGTPHGPPPEIKGLVIGYNGTDFAWRPDTAAGGFKFWVAGPHQYPDYVDGVLTNVENNLGFFSVFIPQAAVQLFTSLTPTKQSSAEAVQSNLEVTYQDLNGVADASPDTAAAMIERCIAKGGEVDMDAKKCMKNGEQISIRSLKNSATEVAPVMPLGYTITEGDDGWWVRSEPFGFSAPKIVAKKRISRFVVSGLTATNRGTSITARWQQARALTVYALPAKLYRVRISPTKDFLPGLTDEVITAKLTTTFRNVVAGKWWVSVAPILLSSGSGFGQETKTTVVVHSPSE